LRTNDAFYCPKQGGFLPKVFLGLSFYFDFGESELGGMIF
jgi:hypothetical protein